MEPHSTPPPWLEILGWISLVAAFVSAAYILQDIFIRRYRQKMPIMEIVYPVTALYFGPATIWFYHRYGRRKSPKIMNQHGGSDDADDSGHNDHSSHDDHSRRSPVAWHQTAEADTHCGAGCTLGDIIAEWSVLALGITIAGVSLYADFIFDFILAWVLGVIFQYFTIVPMSRISKLEGLKQAVKADTLSILAFQVGLFAGMFSFQMLIFSDPLPKTTASYWFLMQLSMIVGFLTAFPVNRWLVKKGIKEAM